MTQKTLLLTLYRADFRDRKQLLYTATFGGTTEKDAKESAKAYAERHGLRLITFEPMRD